MRRWVGTFDPGCRAPPETTLASWTSDPSDDGVNGAHGRHADRGPDRRGGRRVAPGAGGSPLGDRAGRLPGPGDRRSPCRRPLDRWHDPDASARSWRRAVSDLVERTWCAPLSRAATAHRVEVREGHPVDVLLTAAATEDTVLVVVGSRGMGADPAVALGSTSLQVLHAARVPVLVVPGRRRGSDRPDLLVAPRLLVGVDGSQPSLAALALAADVAELAGGSLRVLHVFGRRLRPRGQALDRTMTLVEAELRGIRERGLARRTIVRSGDPAPTILEVADDVDADLVVVGTRGHAGQAELLPDSVARTVAGRAERPTLVVPAAAGQPSLATRSAGDGRGDDEVDEQRQPVLRDRGDGSATERGLGAEAAEHPAERHRHHGRRRARRERGDGDGQRRDVGLPGGHPDRQEGGRDRQPTTSPVTSSRRTTRPDRYPDRQPTDDERLGLACRRHRPVDDPGQEEGQGDRGGQVVLERAHDHRGGQRPREPGDQPGHRWTMRRPAPRWRAGRRRCCAARR